MRKPTLPLSRHFSPVLLAVVTLLTGAFAAAEGSAPARLSGSPLLWAGMAAGSAAGGGAAVSAMLVQAAVRGAQEA